MPEESLLDPAEAAPPPVAAVSEAILAEAVAGIGGARRLGQDHMAEHVARTFAEGQHVLVQAGTGTGKSLGYLAPALATLAQDPNGRIVIATATLALQAQLANKDIPAAVAACEQVTGRQIRHAVLKGRSNYACLLRVRQDAGEEQDALVPEPGQASELGAEVVALRRWAEEQAASRELGDRDDAPAHSPAAWAQVSVPVRECLGAQNCPQGSSCLVEKSRDRARASQLVVTNHALLAINAMHGGTALPEFDAVIIDEAHELVNRVTGAASVDLSPQGVERVAKRCLPWLDDDAGLDFLDAADTVNTELDAAEVGRLTDPDAAVIAAVIAVRDAARTVVSGLSGGADDDTNRRQAQAAAAEVFSVAERMAKLSQQDVVWVSESERFGRQLNCAPLGVAELLQERIFDAHPAVLTSATLKIGGSFDAVAAAFGMTDSADFRAIDVGSPFDYSSQGILYLARGLPRPGRDGIAAETLAEVAELLWASQGRTLGLFASQRSAEAAARYCREQVPERPVLCQGDAQLSALTERFIAEPQTSLFGTLSLWQGIDVPGETCQLVIIDKIPFPRPDDPLLQARQQAVSDAGGNGFMAVAATHAGLMLAQGAGRLIRSVADRGVVAILDPRLVTARYSSFLTASLPPFWTTTDREVAIGALQRLATAAATADPTPLAGGGEAAAPVK